ncbi:probable rRNA-processing protein EBP2 isoform X2 [Xyrauchen texanus]|uniref:probable rRNA-processing protein EBP2 isoform X2 n=1 Tax=Xyrauchen texanus TaxID=154827 RepID=UPI0022422462|nr:probable rRNA-processing protein EBP2 isoform X2 [Xyrauchen texanus]
MYMRMPSWGLSLMERNYQMVSPNAKKKYKDKKFGFGGKKKDNKWNTKESYNDVSGFKARVAHGKDGKKFGKGRKSNKHPGKEARRKMKAYK